MLIRPATLTDREQCYAICVETAADGDSAAGLHRHPYLLGDAYVGPYLELEPSHCFVLADDDAVVVGYVLGTPDTHTFAVRADEHWWPAVRNRALAITDPTPADADLIRLIGSPVFASDAVLAAYPAHGHIDLLPAAQGHGMGRALMTTLQRSLGEAGASGMHLGVSAHNTRALGFYARLGFVELSRTDDTVVVGCALL